MKRVLKIISLILAFTLSLTILSYSYHPIIGDNYPQVYDLYWNNKTARWSVDGRANKYEIRLYRDGRRVTTKTQTTRSHSFASALSRGNHEYYFEVRPYNSVTGWGSWEQSDSIYIEEREPITPIYPVDPTPYVPGPGPGENINIPTPQMVFNPAGQWIQANGYWHFVYANGVFAANTWLQLGSKWYYIDPNSNMVVGLVNINQYTYYFNPDGTMVTGSIVYNGVNHYFDGNGRMVY